jgi:glycosyltransferase involved in cell wall biosynthesis
VKVLLVCNYVADAQESMLRFAASLEAGLRKAGVDVESIRPEMVFGSLHPGASGLGKWLGYLDKFLLFPPRLRWRGKRADIVHICDHSSAMQVPSVASRPHLVTCHDLLAVRMASGEFPGRQTRATGRLLQRWILRGLRRARRIACDSEATKRDVMRLAGHDARAASVIYVGQNHAYAPVLEIARAAEARRRGEPFDVGTFARRELPAAPYLIHVGGTQWYKNRAGVLAIHAELVARLGTRAPRLVIVGAADPTPNSAPALIEYRSGVSNDDLAALYSGAELLLFPSLEEGFGWPIIEAQACNCRVVTTRKPPMTEVAGDAAISLTTRPTFAAARIASQPCSSKAKASACG